MRCITLIEADMLTRLLDLAGAANLSEQIAEMSSVEPLENGEGNFGFVSVPYLKQDGVL